METATQAQPQVDHYARNEFYNLLKETPASEAAWTVRQETLHGWRANPRFEAYWGVIEQMLTVDFASFRRLVASTEAMGDLKGYDYDAWREQREYDLKHARDHLP